ncbi:hypothetical protein PRIPAC_78952 [Pristionchus pacificus]|uniref:Uncharacterized protein n=1 Tax=Pristionchus pacificus TaxID=54126 RepID=A0A2A6CQ11_PRIPA|nr:hypothetical protein PRIPAC_78952 [Pristionchus pacificus]|eukprot:PDM80121.1 hypothetical protein PRIPAC_32700 [Pristionchus pacificus]
MLDYVRFFSVRFGIADSIGYRELLRQQDTSDKLSLMVLGSGRHWTDVQGRLEGDLAPLSSLLVIAVDCRPSSLRWGCSAYRFQVIVDEKKKPIGRVRSTSSITARIQRRRSYLNRKKVDVLGLIRLSKPSMKVMAEPCPKRKKEDDGVAHDPFASFFLDRDGKPKAVKGEEDKKEISLAAEKELKVPPVDDRVAELIDPMIGESKISGGQCAAGFGIVDGVRIKLVEPKEKIGQALQGVLETISESSIVTLKDLLAETMSETKVKTEGRETLIKIPIKHARSYFFLTHSIALSNKLCTPKFISYSIKCNLCKVFSDHPLAHMWYHFAAVQPRYQCAHCSMTAGLVEDVAVHMKTVHKSVLVRPLDRINGLREALWSYQAHKCFPDNFKREPEPQNHACDLTDCICGAVVYKEDLLLFNHIVLFHENDGLNYDDPEGTKRRYFFDLDGSIRKRMRGMEKVNIESAKCESLRVRKKKNQEMDSQESEDEEEDEEELEEGEVEGEEKDDSDGLE